MGLFTPAQIRAVNYCRLYVRAVTVSDLTTAAGRQLDQSILAGNPSLYSTRPATNWPQQARPNAPAWVQWRKANRLSADKQGTLRRPLGDWTVTRKSTRRWWPHWYLLSRQLLYKLVVPHQWSVYRCTPGRPLPQQAVRTSATLLPDTIPADIETRRSGDRYRSYALPEPASPAIPPTPFLPSLYTLSKNRHVLFPAGWVSCPSLPDILQAPRLACASDGSAGRADSAAFGWIVATAAAATPLASGAGPAPGVTSTSYRAELFGVWALLTFLEEASRFCQTSVPPMDIYIDNKSALQWCTRFCACRTDNIAALPSGYDPLASDWDVLTELRHLLKATTLAVTFRHVKSHQDDTVPMAQLPLEAKLNVAADKLAAEYARVGVVPSVTPFFTQPAVCLHSPSGTIHRGAWQWVRSAAAVPALRQYYERKHGWSANQVSGIDWEAHTSALRKLHHQHSTLLKLLHGLLPTNAVTAWHSAGHTALCPCCNAMETQQHLFRCPHPDRAAWRDLALVKLRNSLINLRGDPVLIDILVTGVTAWLNDTPPEFDSVLAGRKEGAPWYQHLIAAQSGLGWDQILRGRLDCQWATVQDIYLKHIKRRSKYRSGALFTAGVVRELWELTLDLWKIRNEAEHGRNAASWAATQQQRTERELRSIYDNRGHLPPSTNANLHDTVEEHPERHSSASIRAWIHLFRHVFRASARRARQAAASATRAISTYFPVK